MLSVEIALPEIEELHKLIEQGQEKGFLTYDEIVNALEDVELTKEQLEEFTTYAIDHSIERRISRSVAARSCRVRARRMPSPPCRR